MRYLLNATAFLALSAALAAAQIPEGVVGTYEPHPEARKAISGLYSPYCPGLMLEQCPAEDSRLLRDSIHALALDGWTAGEIQGWFLANHGEEHRAVPLRSGWGRWAWVFPPGALLLGFGFVVVVVRRLRAPDRASADSGPRSPTPERELSPEEEERLRAAIRDLELSEDPSY